MLRWFLPYMGMSQLWGAPSLLLGLLPPPAPPRPAPGWSQSAGLSSLVVQQIPPGSLFPKW